MSISTTTDYDSQGMALKLREHDEALKKYETFEHACEAHLTWCCGGGVRQDKETPP